MAENIEVRIKADASQAQKALHDTAQNIENVAKAASSSKSKINEITAALKTIASNTSGTNAQLTAMASAFKELNSSVSNISKQLDTMAKSASRAGKEVKNLGEHTKGADSNMKGMAASMRLMASTQIGQTIGKLASGFVDVGVSAVMAAAQMRQYEIAFQTMLKSADQGTQMLKDLQQFAANTPFDVSGVVQAGQQLMAFGFKAKEVIPMLTSLGDAAAGLGMKSDGVQRLAYALGQMQTSGKLNTQDMMQLTNAGVAAWDMLAKAAGKSVMEIKELTSQGMIDSKEAVKTIVAGLNSEFGGMMDKTSKEVTGLLSNISETAETTAAVVGQYMIDAFDIKGKLTEVSEALGDFQQSVQEAKDRGDSFSKFLRECVPPELTMLLGALAGVIGVVLVGALGAAIAALVTFAGVSGGVIAAAAAIGTGLSLLLASWDELTAGIDRAIAKVKEFFGLKGGSANADAELAQIQQDEAVFAAGKKTKATNGVTSNSNLIMNGGKSKKSGGGHHKTEEEREIDSLVKKYNKVGQTFKDLAYKAEELKTKASMMFGQGKAIAEKDAELESIGAKFDKINSELKAELELAQKIPNAEDRAYVIEQIEKQISAEEKLRKAKEDAVNYKFEHRNDKSSSDIANSIIDKAFGTEDEMAKKKESLQRFLVEAQDMVKNAAVTGQNGSFKEELSQESQDFLSTMLNRTPEQLQEEFAKKGVSLAEFVDSYSTQLARMVAAQQQTKTIGEQWAGLQVQWISQIGSSMGQAVSDWINGTKSIGQAMKDMVKGLLTQAASLLAEWLMVFAILSIWNPTKVTAAEGANKIVLGIGTKNLATGGFVSGAGTSTSDSIPAMLSDGEYVLNAAAVRQLGVPYLNGLNTGKFNRGYATGGFVSTNSEPVATASAGSSSMVTLNISAMDASGFGDFLARGGLDSIKQAMFDDGLNFATEAGTF